MEVYYTKMYVCHNLKHDKISQITRSSETPIMLFFSGCPSLFQGTDSDSISLMTNNIEHLFIYLLAIPIFSFVKWLCFFLANFFYWVICLFKKLISRVLILQLSYVFGDIISSCVGCVFSFMMVSFINRCFFKKFLFLILT